MPTYLVAFIVSDFKVVSKMSKKHNILVEVAARPEKIERGEGDYALDMATQIVDYFSDIFDMKYPISKLTNVGIPDFSAGAMENFGLITYREKYLTYNSTLDNLNTKTYLTLVIAHEIAHQWVIFIS